MFESDNMEEVDVVVGASTTAHMPRLLARMRRFFLPLERVVRNAFEPYCRSDWTTEVVLLPCVSRHRISRTFQCTNPFFEMFLTTLSIWATHVSALSIMSPRYL